MIEGLHHVTAMTGNIRKNIRFYTEILGLRFVKKTINYDSPDTWHFYFGDATGSPGSVITFFPFMGMPRGQAGVGSANVTGFSVGADSLDFWKKRLKEYQVDFRGPFHRFDESYFTLYDLDGMELELVASPNDPRQGVETPGIRAEDAIKGFSHIELTCSIADKTAFFMINVLDHHRLREENDRIRLYAGENRPGHYVDLVSRPSLPLHKGGIGTVHHVAFSTPDLEAQKALRDRIAKAGIQVSPVQDRQYFHSIYFREPGGILFEIATKGPGFLIDETPETLGQNLKLPSWMEEDREKIEAQLPSLD
ncbi:MAG: ring-cleaving dioxygenase [Bacteroides sp.]|jgi:glyoxalase family protein|nr:ring-cleaving dioxygenase [Bacteroides sp.]